ncbi:MAG: hypothetical protein H6728_17460 [Myxococcales bacterium]|nr:hypothetical protein [Myxococcales bacterium]
MNKQRKPQQISSAQKGWSSLGYGAFLLFVFASGMWQCVAPTQVDPTYKLCQNNNDCSEGTHCFLNSCVSKNVSPTEGIPLPEKRPEPPPAEKLPEPPPAEKLPEPPPPEKKVCPEDQPECQFCIRKEDCGLGKICVIEEGICRPGCVNKDDCLDAQKPYCDTKAKLCKACVDTRDCRLDKPGTLCVNDVCADCQGDMSCQQEYGTDSKCVSGKCAVTQCTTNNDCVGKCTPEGDCLCLQGKSCGFCSVDTDCGTGRTCTNKKCIVVCQQDADCNDPGLACRGNRCVRAIVPNTGGFAWSDGTFAADCAEYRYPTKAGYAAASSNGVYKIKPAGSASEFSAYCDMTYAGGGWTLVLKADGTAQTFNYSSQYWTNNKTYPESGTIDADLNATEAKLESYWTVPVDEILFQMKTGTDSTRSGIAHVKANSMLDILKKAPDSDFDQEMGETVWRSLVKTSSLTKGCKQEGINITDKSGGAITGLRLGFVASDSASCNLDSAVGFGFPSSLSVGNRIAAVPEYGGPQVTAAFGYIFVRRLVGNTNLLVQDQSAFAPPVGAALPSCLDYRLPPYASTQDGVYWIKPATQTTRKQAYCLMSKHGGGWALTMKIDGSKATLRYDNSLWKDGTHFGEDKLSLNNDGEAKFESFSTYPFSQVAIAYSVNGKLNVGILHKQSPSLRSIFTQNNPSVLDYSLGPATWRSLLPDSPLPGPCFREGFNIVGTNMQTRIGILTAGNETTHCAAGAFYSRLGVGLNATDCVATNISAGSEAKSGCGTSTLTLSPFTFVLLR